MAISKSYMFKKAHEIAKYVVAKFGYDYRASFRAALKRVWQGVKLGANVYIIEEEQKQKLKKLLRALKISY